VTDIGYEHDARYFQGIFNHSQVLGIVTSLFSLIVFIIILNQKNFSLKAIFFIAIFTSSLILIFLTFSRTALLSLFFSVIIFVFFSTFFKKKNFLVTYNIFLNKNFSTLGILLLLPLIFFYDYFYRILITFLEKNSNIENLIDSYISSRMIVIEPMIENIKTKWLTGIGFGIPSFDTYSSIKQITFETLIFFTYEKGNLYLLILEELGLLGILIFIFWLFLLIQRLILSGDNIALIVVINILLINIGEAVVFSTGGLGLLILILLFWAATRPNSLSKNSYEKF
jgi:O-antigen ligase